MIFAHQSHGHNLYGSLKSKMTYFSEITGPRSLAVQHYSGKQILVSIFHKPTSSTL